MRVTCLRLDDMGRGITKVDGKTTFVNNFIPGEEADIKITLSKKSYNEGVKHLPFTLQETFLFAVFVTSIFCNGLSFFH